MIKIGKPFIKENSKTAKLCASVHIDGKKDTIFFETDIKWNKYLTTEVADAFVVGLLHRALCLGHDIISEAPISESVLYGLENILIPNLCFGDKNINNIKIIANTIKSPTSSGAVGTGLSCGIDSFQAIKENSSTKFPGHKITHLCFFNCGAFYSDEKNFWKMQKLIKNVAKQMNLPLIIGNSNIHKVIPGDYQITHSFYSLFCVLALRKLFSLYYYASTEAFIQFSAEHASIIGNDSSRYDLMTFFAISDENLRLYSAGAGVKTRIEKTKQIMNDEIVQKNIDVCVLHKENNCGKCIKCRRTMLQLWMLGTLDKFNNRFPVTYFYNNLKEYIKWMKKNKNKTILEKETYIEYKNKYKKESFFKKISRE